MLRESFVPVLWIFALLWGALAVLHSMAETQSRQPAVIRIAAADVSADMTPDAAGPTSTGRGSQ